MTCYQHADRAATAFCRSCGRPLCAACQMRGEETVFCPDHFPASGFTGTDPNASNPYTGPINPAGGPASPVVVQTSPGLAFLLGLIPGVGAIYNGQYVKGLAHALVFGLLVSLTDSVDGTAGQPFLGILSMVFYFYMPFEAYHTARKRRFGLPLDEWSSVISSQRFSTRTPTLPIVLIVIGTLFLLDSLHWIPFREVGRFWPVALIVIGAYMLKSRLSIRVDKVPPDSPTAAAAGSTSWQRASGAAPIVTETTTHEQ